MRMIQIEEVKNDKLRAIFVEIINQMKVKYNYIKDVCFFEDLSSGVKNYYFKGCKSDELGLKNIELTWSELELLSIEDIALFINKVDYLVSLNEKQEQMLV